MDDQPRLLQVPTAQPVCAKCGNMLSRAYAKAATQDGVLLCHKCSTHSKEGDIAKASIAVGARSSPDSFSPYTVQVVVSAMNVRTGPSKTYPTAELVHSGMQLSIIEEVTAPETPESKELAKWGRLEREEPRWILLKYTRRVR